MDHSQPQQPHRGWHSRGYLPHFDSPERTQGITFRLHDSVPAEVLAQWEWELRSAADPTSGADTSERATLHERIARYEDEGHGACYLRSAEIAQLTVEALQHNDGLRYDLAAWCVMPNHVHVLVRQKAGCSMSVFVQSWKRRIAREANHLLNRTGEPFWAVDYYDRYIRDEAHYGRALHYIHQNPVSAGLCAQAQDWPWSSA